MRAPALVLLSSLLAATARAEAPPSEVKPAEPPHEEFHEAVPVPAPTHVHEARAIPDAPSWQIGAGLFVGSSSLAAGSNLLGSLGSLGSLSNVVTAPTAQVAVERRLGDNTWLGLGATVTFSHQSGDGTAAINSGGVSSPGTQVTTDGSAYGGSVGVRQVLTPHEVVELSVNAVASVGYGYTVSDTVLPAGGFGQDTTQTFKLKSLTAGLSLGIAAEKPLTERLALRASLGLLGLSYSKNTLENSNSIDPTTVATNATSGFAIGLEPSASLTLRFLF